MRFVGLLGHAVLAIWNDVAPGQDDEFNHWHISEHIPERVAIPGFRRGRRYTVVSGAPRYFTLYETETAGVLSGPDYVARLNNPTPWTRKCIQYFRNNRRTVCRVTASLGAGVGGVVATLELGPAPGRERELRDWLVRVPSPDLARRPGIVGVHLAEADLDTTRVRAEEKTLLHRPDDVARWVLLVEGTDAVTVGRACGELLDPGTLAAHGALPDSSLATYALVYCLAR